MNPAWFISLLIINGKCPVGRISHIIQLKHEAPHVENPGEPPKTLSRECRTPWMPNCAREKTGQTRHLKVSKKVKHARNVLVVYIALKIDLHASA